MTPSRVYLPGFEALFEQRGKGHAAHYARWGKGEGRDGGRRLERPLVPGTRDGEGNPRRLDVDEQPLAVRAKVRAGPLLASVAARRDRLSRSRNLSGRQTDVVLGERESVAVERQADQPLTSGEVVGGRIFAQKKPAARRDGDVVRIIELVGGR